MSEKLKIIVDDKGNSKVWMDGKEVKGIQRIEFEHEVEYTPKHTITFVTPVGGIEDVR